MRVVIDIPDDNFNRIRELAEVNGLSNNLMGYSLLAIAHGTVLPKAHGDLIDREEFLKTFLDSFWGAVKEGNSSFEVVGVVKNIIRNAPIVIEADQENKE